MSVALAILSLLAVIVIHEVFGHFLACVLTGIRVNALYLGVPLGPRLRLQLGDYPISISLLPFIAAVEVNEESLSAASLWRRIIVYVAGPVANILSALLVIFLVFGSASPVILGNLYHSVAGGIGMLLSGQIPMTEAIVGPVGAVADSSEIIKEGGWVLGSVAVFVLLSLGIGVFNLLPIPALDGGRVAMDILVRLGLPEGWAKKINAAFLILLLALMAVLTAKELVALIGLGWTLLVIAFILGWILMKAL